MPVLCTQLMDLLRHWDGSLLAPTPLKLAASVAIILAEARCCCFYVYYLPLILK